MNQRISQPLTSQSSRPTRHQHRLVLRATALVASAAAGALTIVIANGISGGDGIQGTGHSVTAAGAVPADNGILTGDEAVTPADNGLLSTD